MKSTIRCCISCILPCGALDVIRIVHSNGRVEEIGGTVKASEIMKAYPKHVLKRPSSKAAVDGVVPKIVIVPPDAELRRGKIYFLMPVLPAPTERNKPQKSQKSSSERKKRRNQSNQRTNSNSISNSSSDDNMCTANLLVSSDRYLSDILSENISTQKDRRRGRVAVWRPHLESISESPTNQMKGMSPHQLIEKCNVRSLSSFVHKKIKRGSTEEAIASGNGNGNGSGIL